jgi:putative toxin-antitoxin system antitoxin component (TIGR02293 family)
MGKEAKRMVPPTPRDGKAPQKRVSKIAKVGRLSNTTTRKIGMSYATIAAQSPSENSEVVRRGVPAEFVRRLADDLAIDQSMLTDHMGIARSTFSRKLKNAEALSNGDGAIALGVARIIGEVDRILRESGDPEQMGESFHVAEWTGQWLKQPVMALGNRRPLDYLDNAFGQETVLQLIRQMQSGAFA